MSDDEAVSTSLVARTATLAGLAAGCAGAPNDPRAPSTSDSAPVPTTSEAPRASADPPVTQSLDRFRFARPEDEQHTRWVAGCLDDVTREAGWRRWPLTEQSGGWCKGTGFDDGCVPSKSIGYGFDQRSMRLTMVLDAGHQVVENVFVFARSVPAHGGFGATLGYVYGGSSFSLKFTRFKDGAGAQGDPEMVIRLGRDVAYDFRDGEEVVQQYQVTNLADPLEEVRTHAASSQTIRDRYVPLVEQLRDAIDRSISAHQPKHVDCGSRECRSEPLAPDAEARLRARAESDLAAWLDALTNHHGELRDALLAAFPVERCWR